MFRKRRAASLAAAAAEAVAQHTSAEAGEHGLLAKAALGRREGRAAERRTKHHLKQQHQFAGAATGGARQDRPCLRSHELYAAHCDSTETRSQVPE